MFEQSLVFPRWCISRYHRFSGHCAEVGAQQPQDIRYNFTGTKTHGGDFFLLGLQSHQQLGLLVLHLVHHQHEVLDLVPCGFQQRRLDFLLASTTKRDVRKIKLHGHNPQRGIGGIH